MIIIIEIAYIVTDMNSVELSQPVRIPQTKFSTLSDLLDAYPSRSEQIQLLTSLIGSENELSPNLFIYGHAATGKTLIVREVCTLQQNHSISNTTSLQRCHS
jgi:Cdc6-like AAA superfamily ATPase